MIGYGRIPFPVIEAGGLAGLPGAAAAVYAILCAHADNEWVSRPGVARLAQLTGVDERTARRATRALIDRGLLVRVADGGGRARAACYRIETDPTALRNPGSVASHSLHENPDTAARVSPAETRTFDAPKPGHFTPETRTFHARNPGVAAPPTYKNRTEQQQNMGGAAAGGCAGDDKKRADPVADALALAGVGEPKRSDLAAKLRAIPDAPAKIARAARDTNERGKGKGALIRELEALADAERIRQARRAEAKMPRPVPIIPRPPAAKEWQPAAIQAAAEADEGRFAVVLARVVEREFTPARQRQIQALVKEHGKTGAVKRDDVLRAAMCRALGLQDPRLTKVEVAS